MVFVSHANGGQAGADKIEELVEMAFSKRKDAPPAKLFDLLQICGGGAMSTSQVVT